VGILTLSNLGAVPSISRALRISLARPLYSGLDLVPSISLMLIWSLRKRGAGSSMGRYFDAIICAERVGGTWGSPDSP
jgi:hypothetical protein